MLGCNFFYKIERIFCSNFLTFFRGKTGRNKHFSSNQHSLDQTRSTPSLKLLARINQSQPRIGKYILEYPDSLRIPISFIRNRIPIPPIEGEISQSHQHSTSNVSDILNAYIGSLIWFRNHLFPIDRRRLKKYFNRLYLLCSLSQV